MTCPSEHKEQVAVVEWMRKNHPQHRIFSIPNGGSRHIVEAMNLKAEGATAGVPDLFIPSLKLFIEMKKQKGGTVSAGQKDWIAYLLSCGYRAEVAKGFEEAKAIILKYI